MSFTIQEFDKLLMSISQSKAFAALSEKLCGENLSHFGPINKTQLEEVIKLSNLNSKKIFADLGCGTGRIAELVSTRTGAKGVGFENAPTTIDHLRSNSKGNCTFEMGDLNKLTLGQKFDTFFALDSLYFVEDLQKLLRELFRNINPGGRFIALYSQRPRNDISNIKFDAHGTLLGQALKRIGIHYQWSDYSIAEVNFWNKMSDELQQAKSLFDTEGHYDLYFALLKDVEKALTCIRLNTHCRFLYSVRFE